MQIVRQCAHYPGQPRKGVPVNHVQTDLSIQPGLEHPARMEMEGQHVQRIIIEQNIYILLAGTGAVWTSNLYRHTLKRCIGTLIP